MAIFPREILEALGLTDDSTFSLEGEEGAPEGPVAFGRGTTQALPVDELLALPLARREVQLPALRDHGIMARRLIAEPGVVLVSLASDASQPFGGAQRRAERDYVLDARQWPASLLIHEEGGHEAVLHLTDRGDILFFKRELESARMAALPHLEPAAPISLPAVDVERLLGGESAPAWLLDEVIALARSPSALSRAVGVGLIGRLWSPTGAPAASLARALLGQGVAARARAWAVTLTAGVAEGVERLAVLEADALCDRLTAVADGAWEPGGAEVLVAWLHRRDDLTAAAFVLEAAGAGEALRHALEAVDAAAAEHLTALSAAALPPDPRLSSVAWQEPERWWGGLALGR